MSQREHENDAVRFDVEGYGVSTRGDERGNAYVVLSISGSLNTGNEFLVEVPLRVPPGYARAVFSRPLRPVRPA